MVDTSPRTTEVDHADVRQPAPDGDATSRRALLRGGTAVAAVAAVAGLSSRRAYAANLDTMYVGVDHTATAQTKLSGGSTFWVQNGATSGGASLYGSQAAGAGSYGVHGSHSGEDGVGVYGDAGATSGIGVYGEAGATSGKGVYGIAAGSSGMGVHGIATGTSGMGVYGQSDKGSGLIGSGAPFDVQADGGGRVGLTQAGNAGSATDTGSAGTIARDAAGNLWYCYATHKWRRLGGAESAGALHPIEPTRAYDSRQALPTPGQLADGQNRVVFVAHGRSLNGGAVTDPDIVPSGATAVTYNLTIVNTVLTGFLSVTPGDAPTFKASSINWSASGLILANAGLVKLDASRQVKVFCGGGSTDFIIDITGFYI